MVEKKSLFFFGEMDIFPPVNLTGAQPVQWFSPIPNPSVSPEIMGSIASRCAAAAAMKNGARVVRRRNSRPPLKCLENYELRPKSLKIQSLSDSRALVISRLGICDSRFAWICLQICVFLPTVGVDSRNLHPDSRKPRFTNPKSDYQGILFCRAEFTSPCWFVRLRHFWLGQRVQQIPLVRTADVRSSWI